MEAYIIIKGGTDIIISGDIYHNREDGHYVRGDGQYVRVDGHHVRGDGHNVFEAYIIY